MASSVAALLIDDRIYHSHAGEWPPKCYRDQLAPVRFCLAMCFIVLLPHRGFNLIILAW